MKDDVEAGDVEVDEEEPLVGEAEGDDVEITEAELKEILEAIEEILAPYDKLKGFKVTELRFEEDEPDAFEAVRKCKICVRGRGCRTVSC